MFRENEKMIGREAFLYFYMSMVSYKPYKGYYTSAITYEWEVTLLFPKNIRKKKRIVV